MPAWRHALCEDQGCVIFVLLLAMYMHAGTSLHMQAKGYKPSNLGVHCESKTFKAVLMLFRLMDVTTTTEHITRLWRTHCKQNSVGDKFGDQIRHKRHLLGHGLDVQLYILQVG